MEIKSFLRKIKTVLQLKLIGLLSDMMLCIKFSQAGKKFEARHKTKVVVIGNAERINLHRYDTWVCVEFLSNRKIDYETDGLGIDLLCQVNNCKSDEFYNERTATKNYSKAIYVCQCKNDKDKSHWILE